MTGVYVRNSAGVASVAANRSLAVPWTRFCRVFTSTTSKNFPCRGRRLRVELMGIEPTASRVRFTLKSPKTRGERKVAFPGGPGKEVGTDGGTKRENASSRFLRAEVRS